MIKCLQVWLHGFPLSSQLSNLHDSPLITLLDPCSVFGNYTVMPQASSQAKRWPPTQAFNADTVPVVMKHRNQPKRATGASL